MTQGVRKSHAVDGAQLFMAVRMMPYFPLVVVYCQRYVKSTGIGTLTSLMLPYLLSYLLAWSALLMQL